MKTKIPEKPEVGHKLVVPSSMSLSHGSTDIAGCETTVMEVKQGISAGKKTWFVRIDAKPRSFLNYEVLRAEQTKLRKEYKGQKAHADPDIDTPWIQKGDTVDGKLYTGPDIQ